MLARERDMVAGMVVLSGDLDLERQAEEQVDDWCHVASVLYRESAVLCLS